MKGQARLYEPPEPPTRPCVLCGDESTHEADYRHAAWVQTKDLCEGCARSEVAACRPNALRRIARQPKPKAAAPATLPLDG